MRHPNKGIGVTAAENTHMAPEEALTPEEPLQQSFVTEVLPQQEMFPTQTVVTAVEDNRVDDLCRETILYCLQT